MLSLASLALRQRRTTIALAVPTPQSAFFDGIGQPGDLKAEGSGRAYIPGKIVTKRDDPTHHSSDSRVRRAAALADDTTTEAADAVIASADRLYALLTGLIR